MQAYIANYTPEEIKKIEPYTDVILVSVYESNFNKLKSSVKTNMDKLNTLKDKGDLYQKEEKWLARDNIDWEKLPAKVEGVISELM